MKQTRKPQSLPKVPILVLLIVCISSPLFADNWFDEQFSSPYNEALSITSDITSIATVLAPGAFLFAAPSSDWVEIGLIYVPTTLASYAVRTVLKNTITRQRPYMLPGYGGDLPLDLSDGDDSFPSGHTLMAFSSAAFMQAEFILNYPDSPYRRAVTLTTWALAATTAVLRVASGNHFVTDVLAGAAIGSALGFAGPYLNHLLFKDKERAPTLMIGPSVGLQVRL